MLSPSLTTVRLFLHILAASVWVGGQIALAGVVPTVRKVSPEATKAVARAFARVAWPAFAVVVLTGIWNLSEVHALTDSILAIVQHAVGRQHGVLVIDDVQWADSDVLAVINRLVRSRLPCTTVIATRSLEEEGDYLVQFLTELRGGVETEHLELAPLQLAEVSDLLRRTVGLAATSFAADVHERTGGHPFLIRQLLDTGQLSSTADAFDLPRTVTESTRRSLIRLSDDARATVEAAATLGRTSGFHELARFTGFDEPRLLAAVQELCDERLLTEPASDEFAFAHVLAQQAVNESIVSRQRRRLHDLDLAEIHALSAWYTGRHAEACRVALAVLPSVDEGDLPRRTRLEWLVARAALNSGAMHDYDAAVQRLIDMLEVFDWPGDAPTLTVNLPNGPARLRVSWTGLVAGRFEGLDDDGISDESVAFELWPAPIDAPSVVRQWPAWPW